MGGAVAARARARCAPRRSRHERRAERRKPLAPDPAVSLLGPWPATPPPAARRRGDGPRRRARRLRALRRAAQRAARVQGARPRLRERGRGDRAVPARARHRLVPRAAVAPRRAQRAPPGAAAAPPPIRGLGWAGACRARWDDARDVRLFARPAGRDAAAARAVAGRRSRSAAQRPRSGPARLARPSCRRARSAPTTRPPRSRAAIAAPPWRRARRDVRAHACVRGARHRGWALGARGRARAVRSRSRRRARARRVAHRRGGRGAAARRPALLGVGLRGPHARRRPRADRDAASGTRPSSACAIEALPWGRTALGRLPHAEQLRPVLSIRHRRKRMENYRTRAAGASITHRS